MKPNKETRVLIVEDEADLREGLAFDLKRKGFQVSTAPDGEAGFKLAEKQGTDIVISDSNMPGRDGQWLLDRVKTLSKRPTFVLMGSYGEMAPEDLYSRGADAIIYKPFDRRELYQVMLKGVTPQESLWQENPARAPADHMIELRFGELERVIEAHILDIGRGGMFVALSGALPDIDQVVEFKLHFEPYPAGSSWIIEGSGTVRWTRTESSVNHLRGCGIEFDQLCEGSRAKIVEYLSRRNIRAYIPR